jgi:hypothetical protein
MGKRGTLLLSVSYVNSDEHITKRASEARWEQQSQGTNAFDTIHPL